MNHAPNWQSRPLFVTSTFLDMHAERDCLKREVFPELAERLRKRRHHLETVDLRWGIDVVDLQQETAKELVVLRTCLAKIDYCRPFQIVLLGDRYGWTPPAEQMLSAIREVGYETDVAEKSVTALEIEYGLKGDPPGLCLFYFRQPLPYTQMSPATAAQYSDEHHPEQDIREQARALAALKAELKDKHPNCVRDYEVAWDTATERVTDLAEFKRQVLEDVWAAMDATTSRFTIPEPASWLDAERYALEEFTAGHALGFVGHDELIQQALELALSKTMDGDQNRWCMFLLGETGMGKSAAFSHMYERLRVEDVVVLAHAVGVTIDSSGYESMLRRWSDELVTALQGDGVTADVPPTSSVADTFAKLLALAAEKRRVVLLIDSVDQFRSERGECLTWLPEEWPDNARLIVTACRIDQALMPHLSDPAPISRKLDYVDEAAARLIARSICHRHGRQLHPDVEDVLKKKTFVLDKAVNQVKPPKQDWVVIDTTGQWTSPRAATPLWWRLAVEELNALDAEDYAKANRNYAGAPDEQLHQLLLDTAEALPANESGLCTLILERLERRFGQPLIRAVCSIFFLGPYGWRKSDLLRLVPSAADILDGHQVNFPGETFSEFRLAMRGHLARRGLRGQWKFMHHHMAHAVRDRYGLTAVDLRKPLHTLIARHFHSLPDDDPIRQSELLNQALLGGDYRLVVDCLSHPLSGEALAEATYRVATLVAAKESNAAGEGAALVDALLAVVIPVDQAVVLCRHINKLTRKLEVYASLQSRKRVGEANLAKLEQLQQGSMPLDLSDEIAEAHMLLGHIFTVQGDLADAIEHYESALRDLESDEAQVHFSASWPPTLADTLHKLSSALLRRDEPEKALPHVTRATSIRKTLLEQSPDDGIRHTELVESYLLMGDVHRQLRELKSAEGAYRLAENSQERLIQRKPNNRASQFLLVTCESRLGDVHWLKDEIDDALAVFTQVNQKLSKLAYKLQGTSEFDLLRSHALFKIAEAHYLRAEPAAAWTAVDESLQHVQRCVAQHPDLLQPRMHLGHVQMTAGQIQDMLHDWPAAVWAYEQAIETKQDLLQRVPDKVGATRDQANVYWLLGRARERTGDRRSALAAFKESRVRYRELFLNADGDGELFRLARQGSNSVWRVWMLNWTGRCFMSLVIAGLFVATAVLFMWGQSWWPIGFLPGMAGLLLTITFVGNNVWGYYDLRRAQRELVEASKTGASSND